MEMGSQSCLAKPLVMLKKIPSLLQLLVLLGLVSPSERDLVKLPNCPLPSEHMWGWQTWHQSRRSVVPSWNFCCRLGRILQGISDGRGCTHFGSSIKVCALKGLF